MITDSSWPSFSILRVKRSLHNTTFTECGMTNILKLDKSFETFDIKEKLFPDTDINGFFGKDGNHLSFLGNKLITNERKKHIKQRNKKERKKERKNERKYEKKTGKHT